MYAPRSAQVADVHQELNGHKYKSNHVSESSVSKYHVLKYGTLQKNGFLRNVDQRYLGISVFFLDLELS